MAMEPCRISGTSGLGAEAVHFRVVLFSTRPGLAPSGRAQASLPIPNACFRPLRFKHTLRRQLSFALRPSHSCRTTGALPEPSSGRGLAQPLSPWLSRSPSCVSSLSAASPPDNDGDAARVAKAEEGTIPAEGSLETPAGSQPWWKMDAAELKEKVAKLGLAAVLAYGLFDGITYTTFFVLAFLGYERSTGENPAANLKALLGIVVLMWTGNNVTRPFRVAGAAALAPVLDKGLNRLQKALRLPNQFLAFLLVVVTFASLCLSVVGLLILSRLGK